MPNVLLWKRSECLLCWYWLRRDTRAVKVRSGLMVVRHPRNYLISLSLGYLVENSSTSFSFK